MEEFGDIRQGVRGRLGNFRSPCRAFFPGDINAPRGNITALRIRWNMAAQAPPSAKLKPTNKAVASSLVRYTYRGELHESVVPGTTTLGLFSQLLQADLGKVLWVVDGVGIKPDNANFVSSIADQVTTVVENATTTLHFVFHGDRYVFTIEIPTTYGEVKQKLKSICGRNIHCLQRNVAFTTHNQDDPFTDYFTAIEVSNRQKRSPLSVSEVYFYNDFESVLNEFYDKTGAVEPENQAVLEELEQVRHNFNEVTRISNLRVPKSSESYGGPLSEFLEDKKQYLLTMVRAHFHENDAAILTRIINAAFERAPHSKRGGRRKTSKTLRKANSRSRTPKCQRRRRKSRSRAHY